MAKRPELAGSVTFVALEDMPVGELHPHPENPNRGDLSAIKRSLKKHGQYRTIVAHRDGTILAGHHVWMAATELGWTTVRVERVECSVDAARSVLLADNRLAELGPGVHPESLLQLLQSIESLDGTGYSDEDLAALENDIEPPTPNGDPDDAPPLPKKSRAKAGEIWLLGKHRLAVGDSTNEALMDRLFTDWDRPAGIITDPPYGVDYVGGTKDKLRVGERQAAKRSAAGSDLPGAGERWPAPRQGLALVCVRAVERAAVGVPVGAARAWLAGSCRMRVGEERTCDGSR